MATYKNFLYVIPNPTTPLLDIASHPFEPECPRVSHALTFITPPSRNSVLIRKSKLIGKRISSPSLTECCTDLTLQITKLLSVQEVFCPTFEGWGTLKQKVDIPSEDFF